MKSRIEILEDEYEEVCGKIQLLKRVTKDMTTSDEAVNKQLEELVNKKEELSLSIKREEAYRTRLILEGIDNKINKLADAVRDIARDK
ncbi:hypothetical protein ACWCL1_04945 [Ligilactobacillus sp. LYQ135]